MPSPKHLYAVVGILALSLIGGMALYAYIGSERDVTRAETVKADVQKQIADLRGDLKDTLEAIRKDREQVKTPAQIAQAVPRYTPDVRPILVIPNGPQPQPSTGVDGQITYSHPIMRLADAPSAIKEGSLIIPPEQVKPYWDSVTHCAEDSAKLDACQKTVPLLETRAAAAEKAMKGGSRWARFKAAGKYIGIGSAIGGGLVLALKH